MVHMATKVERQLRKGHVRPRSLVPSKTELITDKVDFPTGAKGKYEISLNALVMLNVSGVKGMDIMLRGVQTRES